MVRDSATKIVEIVAYGPFLEKKLGTHLPPPTASFVDQHVDKAGSLSSPHQVLISSLWNTKPPGSDLFSHTLANAVSSALGRFTSVFGMGTGGAASPKPPGDSATIFRALQGVSTPNKLVYSSISAGARGCQRFFSRLAGTPAHSHCSPLPLKRIRRGLPLNSYAFRILFSRYLRYEKWTLSERLTWNVKLGGPVWSCATP